MAYDMLDEGLIDEDTALLRVDADRLEELFKRRVNADGVAEPIAKGLNASPGAATGEVVFTADEAEARARDGAKVVLVRRETTPDDYHGMIAAQGILTSAGGTNSHAAVVARGEGIPAVCGADAIKLDIAGEDASRPTARRSRRARSSRSTGSPGNVYVGELPLEESVLEKARSGDAAAREEKIWTSVRAADGACGRAQTSAGPRERRYARPVRRTRASAAPRASASAAPSTCSSAGSASRPSGR